MQKHSEIKCLRKKTAKTSSFCRTFSIIAHDVDARRENAGHFRLRRARNLGIVLRWTLRAFRYVTLYKIRWKSAFRQRQSSRANRFSSFRKSDRNRDRESSRAFEEWYVFSENRKTPTPDDVHRDVTYANASWSGAHKVATPVETHSERRRAIFGDAQSLFDVDVKTLNSLVEFLKSAWKNDRASLNVKAPNTRARWEAVHVHSDATRDACVQRNVAMDAPCLKQAIDLQSAAPRVDVHETRVAKDAQSDTHSVWPRPHWPAQHRNASRVKLPRSQRRNTWRMRSNEWLTWTKVGSFCYRFMDRKHVVSLWPFLRVAMATLLVSRRSADPDPGTIQNGAGRLVSVSEALPWRRGERDGSSSTNPIRLKLTMCGLRHVTSRHVTSCCVMLRHVASCCTTSRGVTSSHVVVLLWRDVASDHLTSRDVASRHHVTKWPPTSRHVTWWIQFTSRRVTSLT